KEIKDKDIQNVVGLDFAMDGLFVDSDGKKANYLSFYRQMLDRLAKEQPNYPARKKVLRIGT
ncbi:transposase, partial [Shouchella clausii]